MGPMSLPCYGFDSLICKMNIMLTYEIDVFINVS